MRQDLEHLQLLAIFHYVVGGLTGLCACLPIIHLIVGISIVSGLLPQAPGEPTPAFVGWFFIGIATVFIVLGWTLAICMILAGRMLQRCRGYLFCLIMAGIACMWMPLGTPLGVLTFIVLLRPSVKALFDGAPHRSHWIAPEIVPQVGIVRQRRQPDA